MIATKSIRVLAGLLWLLLWPADAVAQQADWERHMRAGLTAYQQGRYAEAEPLYKRALRILGPAHPGVATSLNNQAALYAVQGR